MYALPLLHKILRKQCPKIHSTRLSTCLIAVQALTEGAKAYLTSLGRGLPGHAYDKHKIKRMDRLLSNDFLYQERHQIYSALTQQLLGRLPEPVIAIDWVSFMRRPKLAVTASRNPRWGANSDPV